MHTRGDLAKALKALISHAKTETAATDHHSPDRPNWQSTCWPCTKARQSLEKRSQIQNIHLNAVLAKTSRPCSTIISELLRHVIADQASITSTKRGACIAAHSIYIHTKEQSDAATQDLHEALLSTVVAQLAAPDTGRYQGTVKNIILAATTPQDKPAPRTQNNLAAHFLRLATNTPLPNLSESARRFTIEIIREHASVSPDSDWTKAAKMYNLTTIPKITSSSHTVSRELDKPTVRTSKDPLHCWFHNVNGFVTRWNEPKGDIKKIIAEAASPTSSHSRKPKHHGSPFSPNAQDS
jgi:hypothetical protein